MKFYPDCQFRWLSIPGAFRLCECNIYWNYSKDNYTEFGVEIALLNFYLRLGVEWH